MTKLNVKEAVDRVLDIAPYLYKQPMEMWKALVGQYKFNEVRDVCNAYMDEDERIFESLDPETIMKALESGMTLQQVIDYAKNERKEKDKKA